MKWSLPILLEVIDAAWTILTVFFLWYMIPHISETMRRRKITLWRFIIEEPVVSQLVVAIGVYQLGSLMTHAPTWFARFMSEDGRVHPNYLSRGTLVLAGIVALSGLLCQIRVITKPVYGDRPWLMALTAGALVGIATLVYRW